MIASVLISVILLQLRERLKQIGAMSGLKGIDAEEDEDLGSGKNKMKLNEDFLDEDWDPEKHEVSAPRA